LYQTQRTTRRRFEQWYPRYSAQSTSASSASSDRIPPQPFPVRDSKTQEPSRKRLKLEAIRLDYRLQSRVKIDESTVSEYADAI
jgi:hypothetical protein